MGGGDTKTTQTAQSSTTNPYAPTMPLLDSLLSRLGGISTGVTPDQTAGLDQAQLGLNSEGNFNPAANGAVGGALNFDTTGEAGLLSDAFKNMQGNLAPIANPDNLNPLKTPGLSDALSTLTDDITKNVKGVFAGSGRDPSGSGSFAQSLGRGLMQGEAPVIQQAYQSNVGNLENANSQLESGAQGTASGETGAGMAGITGRGAGLGELASLPGILSAPGMAEFNLANTRYGLPFANLGAEEGLLNPIAGLGGQTSGTGTSTATTNQSPISTMIGGLTGLAGLNGALGNGWLSSLGSSVGGGLSSMLTPISSMFALSDVREKENVAEVGKTHDGQPLYSYNYKGDAEPRIGFLAQEMEKRRPGNVVSIAGRKHVNMDRALARSKKPVDFGDVGMLAA